MTQPPAPHQDPADELRELVSGLRARVAHHLRAGAYAAPGEPSPRVLPPPPAREFRSPEVAALEASPTDRASTAGAGTGSGEPLAQIREDIGDCTRCKLHPTRTNIVFGVGNPEADLMFVGEAPGADEDRRGEPFVGRAGQLLDRMILAMGWTRETVYIANVLKCRPPGNRDPEPDEVEACEGFLARQIASIRPLVIVTLGRPATHLLLRTQAPISRLRGRFQDYRGIRVMPTFHPAYLLRSPDKKKETWSDLKLVIQQLDELGVHSPNPAKA